MVALTREERRGRVLEHHSQGIGTREIAKLLHMSFTDIAKILKDSDKEKESEQQKTREEFLSSRAHKLFSEGKSPVQVAINLNIRASEAIILQREYWDLEGLHNLNRIYEEIKDDTWHFVNLCKSVKAAGVGTPHVLVLLKVANNDLPAVELRYERLKREAAILEFEKGNSARDFQQLNEHIIMMRKTRDSTHLDYEKEMERLRHLQQQRIKQEAIIKHFENNNEEYSKIKKTVQEKVISVLSDRRTVLKLALLSLTESMRKAPDKYSHLIHNNTNTSSTPSRTQATDYDTASYELQQHYPAQAYTDMLLEEAEKLYNKLAKELGDEIISDYASSTSSASLLPLLPQPVEQQSHPTTTNAANQTHMHAEEHRFSQTRIDNDDDNLT